MDKLILLSFDLEEFDVPEEYHQSLTETEKFQVSSKGLAALMERLNCYPNVRATFFITAHYAVHHPATVIELSKRHEIASHGFYHSSFCVEDLQRSRETIENIIGKPVTGFRMARLQPVADSDIQKAGYTYNSSMNPTFLPGRYNHLSKPRVPYYSGPLLNIPVSVTPWVRFPLFWLSFKNLPLWMYKLASKVTLNWDAYLNLYFHPWEFTSIRGYHLPGYIQKHSGQGMCDRLEDYIQWISPQGRFATFSEFQESLNPMNLFK